MTARCATVGAMSRVTFHDVRDYFFPEDVQQCGECAALVLKSNALTHHGWHDALSAEISSKIANAIAESKAAARLWVPRISSMTLTSRVVLSASRP
jgi:hypothetical protein